MGLRDSTVASVREREQNGIDEVEDEIRQSPQSVTRDVQEIHRSSLCTLGVPRKNYF